MPEFVFLTNYAQALLFIAADPQIRMRDLADNIGITERAAARIVSELLQTGYLNKVRVGRRNRYEVNLQAPLRREANKDHTVGELIDLLGPNREEHRGFDGGGTGQRTVPAWSAMFGPMPWGIASIPTHCCPGVAMNEISRI